MYKINFPTMFVNHNKSAKVNNEMFKNTVPFSKSTEGDNFVKKIEDNEEYCPACVDSSPEDAQSVRTSVWLPYACDYSKIRHLPNDEFKKAMLMFHEQGRYFNPDHVVDIYSKGNIEQARLSNFRETRFVMDGVPVKSIEGLLQSLKTSDIERQKEICLLTGKEAKEAGAAIENFDGYNLYWQGKTFTRDSKEYQNLLRRVYEARYDNDKYFREAIFATKDKKLIHTLGSNDPKETILTNDEFIGNLIALRDKIVK